MPTLRNTIIQDILSSLQYGDFCLEDFDASFPDSSDVLAKITFIPHSAYSLTINEGYRGGNIAAAIAGLERTEKDKIIRTFEKPGDFKNNETHEHKEIQEAVSRISTWVRNIKEDLISAKYQPIHTLDEITEQFQQQIDESIEKPNEYFTENEGEELKLKLDELYRRVEELEEKYEIPEKQKKKIETAIADSVNNIPNFPKGVWYKTSGNKVLKALRAAYETKEGREAMLEIVKKLLTSGNGV